MKGFAALVAVTLGLIAAGEVRANDTNFLTLDLTGSDNTLSIVQTGNSLTADVLVRGDHNGGLSGGGWYTPQANAAAPLFGGTLTSGTLEQIGTAHRLSLDVEGSHNLFAARQTGHGHTVTGTVSGQYNQVAVLQTGIGNSAVFRQIGNRNSLSISQTSW